MSLSFRLESGNADFTCNFGKRMMLKALAATAQVTGRGDAPEATLVKAAWQYQGPRCEWPKTVPQIPQNSS